jgi:hydrogenase nickel incorporation protein HypA/HybF
MGIAMEIMRISMASVPKGTEDARVETINLKVGKLSTVVPESLRYCFNILRQGTPLSGAKLNIDEVSVVLRCRDCGSEKTVGEVKFVCQVCGSGQASLISGRELTIESIELADAEGPTSAEE